MTAMHREEHLCWGNIKLSIFLPLVFVLLITMIAENELYKLPAD